ncbi:MAG: RNA polymerase sigma factor [Kiritimatiellae bacterium]|nr:RNA polymerase sigma factor [Kiritimatiellia bacterium]
MDIVEEIRLDKERGAQRLVSEYRAGLMSLAIRFCHDAGDAEELVNRTFAEVISGIDGFLEQSAFFTWMCQILMNLHAKDIRRRSSSNEIPTGELPDVADESAEGGVFRELDASLLRDAIETLPEDIRKTLLLHYFMDMPVRDIARFLSLPTGTVTWRLHYARQMLAAKLGATAKRPGGKALLLALALCGLTALGAAAWSLVGSGEAQDTGAPRPVGAAAAGNVYDFDCPRLQSTATDSFKGENTMDTRTFLAPLPALFAAAALQADTYTWLDSPASAIWDASALNWSDGATSGVAWKDGNDAVFPDASSQKKITLSAMRTANDVTVNGSGYTLDGKLLKVDGKFTANKGSMTLAAGFGGDGVRIGGPSSATVYMGWAGAPTVKTTYLEDNIVIAPNDRRCFGPDPAAPITNVVAAGPGPALFANGNINMGVNRIVRLMQGKTLNLGAATGRTLTIGNLLADPSEGLDFNTNSLVRIPGYWAGAVVLAPPADATNGIGRLTVEGNALAKGGAIRLGSPATATENGALLYVNGNNSAFSATRGNFVVDGSSILAPQSSRYAEVSRWGQVTVTNGGAIHMPGVEWLNGLTMPGRLVVADGEFVVGTLRISQSGSEHGSEILIGKSGVVRASKLRMDNASKGVVTFDGGTFQSTRTIPTDGRELFTDNAARWANVTFEVGEGGAVFDASNGINIWWGRPLESATDHDGGIRKFGSGNLILCAASTYNGPTVVESGYLNARADNAVPDGSTLRLGGGDSRAVFDPYIYEGSPSRPATNWIGRLEGVGDINNCSALHVTGAIAPGADDTIGFERVCDLRGDYEVSANATSCSCIYLAEAGQDISNLRLTLPNPGGLSKDKRDGYRILRAPNGYYGKFDSSALPSGWLVEYNDSSIYLKFPKPFVMVLR